MQKAWPTKGKGYLYAPLKGSRASLIQKIIRNTLSHADLPQEQVQVLILGSPRPLGAPRFYPLETRATAAALLSPAELLEANGGALGLIPPELLEREIHTLPEPVQALWRGGANLRQARQSQARAINDIEETGVLAGGATGDGEQISGGPMVAAPAGSSSGICRRGLSIDASRCLCASAPAWVFDGKASGSPNSSSSVGRQWSWKQRRTRSLRRRCDARYTDAQRLAASNVPTVTGPKLPPPPPTKEPPTKEPPTVVITAPARGDQEPRCITDVPKMPQIVCRAR